MSAYAYIRSKVDEVLIRQEALRHGHELSRVRIEGRIVPIVHVPHRHRPELHKLLLELRRGDQLFLLRLGDLDKVGAEVEVLLQLFSRRGVTVHIADPGEELSSYWRVRRAWYLAHSFAHDGGVGYGHYRCKLRHGLWSLRSRAAYLHTVDLWSPVRLGYIREAWLRYHHRHEGTKKILADWEERGIAPELNQAQLHARIKWLSKQLDSADSLPGELDLPILRGSGSC